MTPMPLVYGRVPIAITKVTSQGNHKMILDGKVILTYLYKFPDGNQVYCILNGNRFRHYRRPARATEYRLHTKEESKLEYEDAYEWLKIYCKHFGWDPNWFDIRITMSHTVHPSIKEGVFDCPVTDVADAKKMSKEKTARYKKISKSMKEYRKKKKHEGFVNMKITVAEGAYERKD